MHYIQFNSSKVATSRINTKTYQKVINNFYIIATDDINVSTNNTRNTPCQQDTQMVYLNVHLFHCSIFRAIFRWICLKDLNKIEIDETVSSESPLGILRGIKQGTESYHDLFKRLCR